MACPRTSCLHPRGVAFTLAVPTRSPCVERKFRLWNSFARTSSQPVILERISSDNAFTRGTNPKQIIIGGREPPSLLSRQRTSHRKTVPEEQKFRARRRWSLVRPQAWRNIRTSGREWLWQDHHRARSVEITRSNFRQYQIRRDQHHSVEGRKTTASKNPDADNLPRPSCLSEPRHVHRPSDRTSPKDPRPRVARGRCEETGSRSNARSRAYAGRTTLRHVPLGR